MRKTTPKPWMIETPHRKGCHALATGAPFQTLSPGSHTLFRNYAGNRASRGAHYLYIRVRCNSTDCPATALVNLNGALVAVGLNDER